MDISRISDKITNNKVILSTTFNRKGNRKMANLSKDGVKLGDVVPDFQIQATNGKNVKISDFRGKWVVLFFYPKAFTPG
ncbi:redoxin domain-containing protein [Candidatus Poribacteria bacterium]|nr:redoxin domain-containing protein [Candidatus Poribacteria bacterium]